MCAPMYNQFGYLLVTARAPKPLVVGSQLGEVDLFFNWNVDMNRTLQLVNAAMARAQSNLPSTAKITVERLTFAAFPTGSVPDGLKVAADGSVWVADARKGRVAVFNPDGTHRDDIAVALPMVTSLCFAGDDLKDLYVVTGSDGGPEPNCGSVFRTRSEVAGLALPLARVAV